MHKQSGLIADYLLNERTFHQYIRRGKLVINNIFNSISKIPGHRIIPSCTPFWESQKAVTNNNKTMWADLCSYNKWLMAPNRQLQQQKPQTNILKVISL